MTWIEQAQRDRTARLWLELSELGIADWATVVSTDECPAEIEGQGRLVTGRFEHSSAEVLSLYVEGERNPIGTTASHPFWSQDRQAFVSAELLTATERLRLEDGRTAAVIRIEQLPALSPSTTSKSTANTSTMSASTACLCIICVRQGRE